MINIRKIIACLKKWYEYGLSWFGIGLIGSIAIFWLMRYIHGNIYGKCFILDTLKYIGVFVAGVGVFFSYFYNKREERKIQVHSEANWRGRLFDLAKKEDLNYHDILYFMTFFNNRPEKENCDFKLLQAIREIINDIGKKDDNSTDNSVTEKVYKLLYENNDEEDGENVCELLEKLCKLSESSKSKSLNNRQRVAFQLCIEFLLKADWNKQMNKESKKKSGGQFYFNRNLKQLFLIKIIKGTFI